MIGRGPFERRRKIRTPRGLPEKRLCGALSGGTIPADVLRKLVVSGLLGALVVASGAVAVGSRDALVRPGVGIGRVSLGMTPAQVERALGRHTLVNRRQRLGFGTSYVEHYWDLGWTVGYTGRPGRLSVVRVSTQARNQRTPARIGVGSRPRDIVRAYPGARCVDHYRRYRYVRVGRYVRVRARNGRVTAFLVGTPWYGRDRSHRVLEVMVASKPLLRGERDWPCPAGWQNE